jgi:hypothetical protein
LDIHQLRLADDRFLENLRLEFAEQSEHLLMIIKNNSDANISTFKEIVEEKIDQIIQNRTRDCEISIEFNAALTQTLVERYLKLHPTEPDKVRLYATGLRELDDISRNEGRIAAQDRSHLISFFASWITMYTNICEGYHANLQQSLEQLNYNILRVIDESDSEFRLMVVAERLNATDFEEAVSQRNIIRTHSVRIKRLIKELREKIIYERDLLSNNRVIQRLSSFTIEDLERRSREI